jgi:DNA-binding NarL/FixJ family response regulator
MDKHQIYQHQGMGGTSGIGQRCGLVLVDFVMPKMNGFQFCRELRREPSSKHLPVILNDIVRVETTSCKPTYRRDVRSVTVLANERRSIYRGTIRQFAVAIKSCRERRAIG